MVGTVREIGKEKQSYSEAVSKKQKSVIIIKPVDENGTNSCKITKRNIKSTIDVAKLGVGITKRKEVTRGAVVVGCENKSQTEFLKEKVTSDLDEKHHIQIPKKKKLKIKIFDVDNEDCENERKFWEKLEEQNGLQKENVYGKIIHKLMTGKSQRATIIAEDATHRKSC